MNDGPLDEHLPEYYVKNVVQSSKQKHSLSTNRCCTTLWTQQALTTFYQNCLQVPVWKYGLTLQSYTSTNYQHHSSGWIILNFGRFAPTKEGIYIRNIPNFFCLCHHTICPFRVSYSNIIRYTLYVIQYVIIHICHHTIRYTYAIIQYVIHYTKTCPFRVSRFTLREKKHRAGFHTSFLWLFYLFLWIFSDFFVIRSYCVHTKNHADFGPTRHIVITTLEWEAIRDHERPNTDYDGHYRQKHTTKTKTDLAEFMTDVKTTSQNFGAFEIDLERLRRFWEDLRELREDFGDFEGCGKACRRIWKTCQEIEITCYTMLERLKPRARKDCIRHFQNNIWLGLYEFW